MCNLPKIFKSFNLGNWKIMAESRNLIWSKSRGFQAIRYLINMLLSKHDWNFKSWLPIWITKLKANGFSVTNKGDQENGLLSSWDPFHEIMQLTEDFLNMYTRIYLQFLH